MDGITPASIIDATGHARTPRGQLAKEALLRNLTILERLGCLTPDNLAKLRRGRAPTITRGPYAGEQAEVDHIVPVSKAPRFEMGKSKTGHVQEAKEAIEKLADIAPDWRLKVLEDPAFESVWDSF